MSAVAASVGAPEVSRRARHTGYPRRTTDIPTFRPGLPADPHPAGPNGHRIRSAPRRCGDPKVAAHAAAVRRRHVLLGILALAAAIALAVPWGTTPDHALAGASPAAGAAAGLTGHAVYVVQPGDTLRSIAQKLDPGGDPRLVMATLRVQNGGDPVRAGERLVVP